MPARTGRTRPITEPANAEDLSTLPPWAVKALAKANAEADSYRERLTEAEARHHITTTAEVHLAAALSHQAELQRAVIATSVAAECGLPASLADRLRGDSEDELRTDARRLLAALTTHA